MFEALLGPSNVAPFLGVASVLARISKCLSQENRKAERTVWAGSEKPWQRQLACIVLPIQTTNRPNGNKPLQQH